MNDTIYIQTLDLENFSYKIVNNRTTETTGLYGILAEWNICLRTVCCQNHEVLENASGRFTNIFQFFGKKWSSRYLVTCFLHFSFNVPTLPKIEWKSFLLYVNFCYIYDRHSSCWFHVPFFFLGILLVRKLNTKFLSELFKVFPLLLLGQNQGSKFPDCAIVVKVCRDRVILTRVGWFITVCT